MRASPRRTLWQEDPRCQVQGQALSCENSSQETQQQQRGNLLAEARWLVNTSHFLMLSHRKTLSVHHDEMLSDLSGSYRLNHYLVLQQALCIDPNTWEV